MTPERIKELNSRQWQHRASIGECWNAIDECLDEIESLQKRNLELEKALKEARGDFQHFAEYWNGSINETAMSDALYVIIDGCERSIKAIDATMTPT